MFPDYPEAKRHAHALVLRGVRAQIGRVEPILAGIRHSTIHEGRAASLTRADESHDDIRFESATAEVTILREQMRRVTIEQLQERITDMARQFAAQQAQRMFAELSRVTDAVGNTVSAKELGEKEAFLEMERRIQMDFDPETLEPKDLMFVVHPSQVEKLKRLSAEWEADPEFVAERNRIRERKIEEWRARENSRQLVD